MSQDVLVKMNMFESEAFNELVSRKMDTLDELRNRLPKEESKELKYVDKSFFKRVISEITSLSYDGSTLIVGFGRGVEMYIDSSSTNDEHYNRNMLSPRYRTLKLIGELVNIGEIVLRTSPFVVSLSKEDLRTYYYESLDQDLFNIGTAVNSHDNGINCWGGWSGPIRYNYDNLEVEKSLLIMIQRMKQLNIDDYAGDISRISSIIKKSYLYETLNIDPIKLAKLVVDYDLQDVILNRSDENYFSRTSDGNLYLLRDVETNISYDIFIGLVSEMKANFTGDKPKIKRRNPGIEEVNIEVEVGGDQ